MTRLNLHDFLFLCRERLVDLDNGLIGRFLDQIGLTRRIIFAQGVTVIAAQTAATGATLVITRP